jgi:hypothetical protein
MALADGTRVRLLADHGAGKAGEEGTIQGTDSEGLLTVKITNRPHPACSAITKLLFGVPPPSVTTDTKCNKT